MGIQWSLTKQYDDLHFAGDIALQTHNHRRIQEKTNIVDETSRIIGLKKTTKENLKSQRVKTNNRKHLTTRTCEMLQSPWKNHYQR